MSETIKLILPPVVLRKLKEKAEKEGITVNDLIIQAIVKILEEK